MDDSQSFFFSLKLVTVHSDGYFVLAPIIIKVILKSLLQPHRLIPKVSQSPTTVVM